MPVLALEGVTGHACANSRACMRVRSHPMHACPMPQIEVLGAASEKAVTKNLLLKDKKSRLFLITALSDTPINLNSASSAVRELKGGEHCQWGGHGSTRNWVQPSAKP